MSRSIIDKAPTQAIDNQPSWKSVFDWPHTLLHRLRSVRGLVPIASTKNTFLTTIGTLQHRPQVDFSTSMASYLDSSLGGGRNPFRSCPKYGRVLRSTLLPWCSRKWPLSGGCFLPVNVVSERRAALPCVSILQRCFSSWCLWRYPGMGET